MSYQTLSRIHRALDSYHWPETFPPIKCLQALRVLFDTKPDVYPGLPTSQEIRSRFYNLAVSILSGNDRQSINELMDTAIHIGINRTELSNWAEDQKIAYDTFRPILAIETNTDSNKYDIFSLKTISHDKQNVHHSPISGNIKKIAIQLCKDYPPSSYWNWGVYVTELSSRKSWSSRNRKAMDFIEQTDVTFGIDIVLKDIFSSLWTWIQLHTHKEVLLDRLNEELSDMSGTCSTGHLSRLINVPQGFTERYKLNILPTEEIKKFIHHDLSIGLSRASEQVQEGILGEKTPEFIDWISQQTQKYIKKFGTNHDDYIKTVISAYLGK